MRIEKKAKGKGAKEKGGKGKRESGAVGFSTNTRNPVPDAQHPKPISLGVIHEQNRHET